MLDIPPDCPRGRTEITSAELEGAKRVRLDKGQYDSPRMNPGTQYPFPYAYFDEIAHLIRRKSPTRAEVNNPTLGAATPGKSMLAFTCKTL